jgi:long-chain fatty acid transport protein
MNVTKVAWQGTLVAAALTMCTSASGALAGGFEIREQSAFFSGTAYAGTGAGGSSLSSIFWNPAASSFVTSRITTDSNYTLVLPNVDLHAESINGAAPVGDADVDIGRDALVPASYYAYRYNDRIVFAASINAPFGLTTKPDNMGWAGAQLQQTSKVFSLNVTPSVSYQLTPHISVGAGLQIQYSDIKALNTSLYQADMDDIAVGGTAGINITPFRGTSIGLGYRSRIEHDFEGKFVQQVPAVAEFKASATLDTPDKVNLSLRQELTSNTRLLASIEWTNWSLLQTTPVTVGNTQPGTLIFNWEDGWMYSIGGEYDVNPRLTIRGGISYEESPIQDATARLIQLPDSNRTWFGLGASYKWSEMTTINVSYLHVELQESRFDRLAVLNGGGTITGNADVNADAVSVGLTMKMESLYDLLPGSGGK